MRTTQLDYQEMLQQVQQQLSKSFEGVLATAQGDFVTARAMMLICRGLSIYFMTPLFTRKYKQILVNPKVAVAIGNMQIDGLASVRGATCDKENAWFMETINTIAPGVYAEYRGECLDSQTLYKVLEIIPQRIALFDGLPNRYLNVLNINEKTATRYYGREGFPTDY